LPKYYLYLVICSRFRLGPPRCYHLFLTYLLFLPYHIYTHSLSSFATVLCLLVYHCIVSHLLNFNSSNYPFPFLVLSHFLHLHSNLEQHYCTKARTSNTHHINRSASSTVNQTFRRGFIPQPTPSPNELGLFELINLPTPILRVTIPLHTNNDDSTSLSQFTVSVTFLF
jgi:hypothetical protein